MDLKRRRTEAVRFKVIELQLNFEVKMERSEQGVSLFFSSGVCHHPPRSPCSLSASSPLCSRCAGFARLRRGACDSWPRVEQGCGTFRGRFLTFKITGLGPSPNNMFLAI